MRYITLSMLERHGACRDGIRRFKRITKHTGGKLAVTKKNWDRLKHLKDADWHLLWLARNLVTDAGERRLMMVEFNFTYNTAYHNAGGWRFTGDAEIAALTAVVPVNLKYLRKYGKA